MKKFLLMTLFMAFFFAPQTSFALSDADYKNILCRVFKFSGS